MKRILVLIIVQIFCISMIIAGIDSGVQISFLSNSKYIDFTGNGFKNAMAGYEFNSMLLKFSNVDRNKIEMNLVCEMLSGTNITTEYQLIDMKRIGVGAEIGKVLSFEVFKIKETPIDLEFVLGGYGMMYIKNDTDVLVDNTPPGENIDPLGETQDEPMKYQFGIYSAGRVVINISKMRILLGLQITSPIKSNEYSDTNILNTTKTFATIGVLF